MKKQQPNATTHWKKIYEDIKEETLKKFGNHFKLKFKKQYHQSNIYTVICSIGFINKITNQIEIITLANGTKSLPYTIYQQHKTFLLKDMHAQILVIKAFRKFIAQQIQKPSSKYFIQDIKTNKKNIDSNIYRLFLYSSEPFCGDCSVNQQQGLFSGGKPLIYFDSKQLPNQKFQKHILRTKPGRSDLPQNKRSLSLSCSDKLALYNIIGIQGKQLFQKIKPVHINLFIVECKQQKRTMISQGLNFIQRLSKLKNYQQNLIERKIFNILIDNKQRKITYQFRASQPQIICLQKRLSSNEIINNLNQIDNNKKKQKEGFQLSLVETKGYFQWINSKTGLPQGSSLNNFNKKGKISNFSKKKLIQNITQLQNNLNQSEIDETFKYTAIKERIKKLFGIWTDSFKSIKKIEGQNKHQEIQKSF